MCKSHATSLPVCVVVVKLTPQDEEQTSRATYNLHKLNFGGVGKGWCIHDLLTFLPLLLAVFLVLDPLVQLAA